MADLLLVVGNKNYSSWSLRPWLAMKVLGIPFREHRIALYQPESKRELLQYSPAGKVPCLVDGATSVWDSLAILEYLAERHPGLWPADAALRARARSISAEMHSGFPNLRQHMSMNVRRRHPGKGRTPEVLAEIARIVAIWSECRGPFLFGPFGAADAMYAPVVLRFRTYEVELRSVCRAYADAVLALPALQEWMRDAERETEVLPQFELYV
ncbi:MAG: glutathione S-transferase family protein [Betaproteobacteria bacterium]|nr:glutathione S-transferase family protein [Betaproteobacteria bacterium]